MTRPLTQFTLASASSDPREPSPVGALASQSKSVPTHEDTSGHVGERGGCEVGEVDKRGEGGGEERGQGGGEVGEERW